MNRAGRLWRTVAPDAAGKRELFEKLPKPSLFFALFRIDLGISTFQVHGGKNTRCTVARAGQEDHVEVVLLDQPIEVNVCERQTRACSPMPKEPVFHVLRLERLFEQWVLLEIDHAEGQVIASAPVCIGLAQLFRAERRSLNGRSG